jgi:hypothetical protein
MSEPTSADEPRREATSAELRHDIDSGRTGERSGGFDPAAAPLGTDAEAGGERTSAAALEQDRVSERAGARRDSARRNAATPELTPDARLPRQPAIALAAAAGLGAGLLIALALAAL